MYQAILFGHVLGATLLVSAVVISLAAVIRASRATTVAQLHAATSAAPIVSVLMPPAMILVLACGLYLVARHGGDGSVSWTSPWVDTAIVIFTLMSILGPLIEDRRTKRLCQAANAAADGPLGPELDRLRRDPLHLHVTFFGACELITVLYLMTARPGFTGCLISTVIHRAPMYLACPKARLKSGFLPAK